MRKRARPTTKADETPEFLEFWSTWRPIMAEFDGRGDARTEFLRHVEEYGVDPMDMVDGAKWFIRNGGNTKVDRFGNLVRIHAASWLNKYAYEDGCEMERQFQARLAAQAKPENVVPIRTGQTAFLKEWNAQQEQKKA